MNIYDATRLCAGDGVWFEKGSEAECYGEVQDSREGWIRIYWETGETTDLAVDDCEGLTKHDGTRPSEIKSTPSRALRGPAHF